MERRLMVWMDFFREFLGILGNEVLLMDEVMMVDRGFCGL